MGMAERLYQLGFDHQFEPTKKDVTPKNFTGIYFLKREVATLSDRIEPTSDYGRFVREVEGEYKIMSPEMAASYLMDNIFHPFSQFDQEELWGLLLDTRNVVKFETLIYRGTIDTAPIRNAELFKEAVRVNAPGLIISHCHPSGDPSPSPDDIKITRAAVEAGQLLGIELMDHIVIGDGRWVSLKERNLGFE